MVAQVNLTCGDCGASLDWALDRVGNQPMLATKCRHCSPGGPWQHEPVEIITTPRGNRPNTLPLAWAPVDTDTH